MRQADRARFSPRGGRALLALAGVVAVAATAGFGPRQEAAEPQFRGEPLAAWLPRLSDLDPDVQHTAAFAMQRFGGRARDAVPALVRMLAAAETTRELVPVRSNAQAAAEALGAIGVVGPGVVDGLAATARRQHDLSQLGHESARAALRALGALGTSAADAVPVLIEVLRRPPPPHPSRFQELAPLQRDAARALGTMGPAAEVAIDALEQVMQRPGDVLTSMAAREAIGAIKTSLVGRPREDKQ